MNKHCIGLQNSVCLGSPKCSLNYSYNECTGGKPIFAALHHKELRERISDGKCGFKLFQLRQEEKIHYVMH